MKKLIAAALAASMLSGCASVTRGWDEQIAVSSTPSGVNAVVTGSSYPQPCITPCSIKVKRADDISIAFDKEGYEPQVVNLTKEVAGTGAAGFAGNILLGGGVGMIVDGVSGAAMDHKPNPVIVDMRLVAAPAPAPIVRPKPRRRAPAKPAPTS